MSTRPVRRGVLIEGADARMLADLLDERMRHVRRKFRGEPDAPWWRRLGEIAAALRAEGAGRTQGASEGQDGPTLGLAAVPRDCDHVTQELFTIEEVARVMNVSTKTVKRLVSAGELRSLTVGSLRRVHRDDLDAYLDSQRKASA